MVTSEDSEFGTNFIRLPRNNLDTKQEISDQIEYN